MVFYCTLSKIHKKILSESSNIIKNIKMFREEKVQKHSLQEEIKLAYEEWENAKNVFDGISDDLIDYAVFRVNAAERKYMYLLNEAKKAGVCAWDESINANIE